MNLMDWIPTAVLSAGVYFCRDRIADYFGSRLQHSYNVKLEKLRSELTQNSADIEALRSGILNAREQRQAILESRRLVANEQVWSAIIALRPILNASTFLAALKFDNALQKSKNDKDLRADFSDLSKQGGWDVFPKHEAEVARLFVSPITWSLFSTYQAILAFVFAKWLALRTGSEDLNPNYNIAKVISAAMPDWKERIERSGTKIIPAILTELEARILNQIRLNMEGHEEDKAAVENAAKIVVLARDAKLTMDTAQAKAETEAITLG